MSQQEQVQEALRHLVQKNVTRLFKSFLEINNEIKNEHEIMLNKVSKKSSPEFAENIDYFTSQKSEYYRKKILDSGNECIREIEALLETCNIELNEKKLDNYVNSKKIIRRRCFPSTTYSKYEDTGNKE